MGKPQMSGDLWEIRPAGSEKVLVIMCSRGRHSPRVALLA
jgi:hypothetical protein